MTHFRNFRVTFEDENNPLSPQSCLGKGISHENFSLIVGESKAVTKIMIITFKTENNRDRSITLLAVCRVIQPRVYWATIAFHH